MRPPLIARRTLLKGMGATIALPLLEAMLPRGASAGASAAMSTAIASSRPPRTVFVYFPNGTNPAHWFPAVDAAGRWIPGGSLASLAPHADAVTVHRGLRHRHAEANGDGPGDHARSAACFLTGAQPKKTAGDDIHAGTSIDQLMADELERSSAPTRIRSLELGTEPAMTAGNCDSGYSCAYSANISWRSATQPNGKETDPQGAFDRLFGSSGMPPAQAAEQARSRRSILDGALAQARALSAHVGAHDRDRLDEYLSAIRDLERQIAGDSLTKVDADAIPDLGGGPLDFERRTDLLFQVAALAMATDTTRIVSFMLANEGSNRPYREVGVTSGHHDVSHHGMDPKKLDDFAAINRFQVARFAAFLSRLKETRDGQRPLLDSTLVLYGSAINDGNAHNHNDLPVLVAGGTARGHSGGSVVMHPADTPLCNLHMALARSAGATMAQFGDSTGEARLR